MIAASDSPTMCSECTRDADICEAGVELCDDCAEDPELMQPVYDARLAESAAQDLKNIRRKMW